VNTDELELALFEAERKVLKVQTKLHGWPVMILIAGSMIFQCRRRPRVPSGRVGSGTGEASGTREPGPPGWTAALRRPSRR
jgi:hypothetical protein